MPVLDSCQRKFLYSLLPVTPLLDEPVDPYFASEGIVQHPDLPPPPESRVRCRYLSCKQCKVDMHMCIVSRIRIREAKGCYAGDVTSVTLNIRACHGKVHRRWEEGLDIAKHSSSPRTLGLCFPLCPFFVFVLSRIWWGSLCNRCDTRWKSKSSSSASSSSSLSSQTRIRAPRRTTDM